MKAIATAAHINPCSLSQIAARPKICRTTETQILAVRATPSPYGLVQRTGSTRRIRALLCMGWTHRELSTRCGVQTGTLVNQTGELLTAANARKVTALYDELCMTRGPSRIGATRAARLGYQPPLAWDDIDDPDATPYTASSDPELLDELLIERAMRGEKVPLTKAERTETITRLASKGVNKSEIARRLRMSYSEVQRRTQPKKAA